MEVCVIYQRKPITTRTLSILLNVPINNIESALCNYHKKKIPYFKRLSKKDGNKYRYVLTDKGFKAYLTYRERILRGFDLNRLHPMNPKRITQRDYVPKEIKMLDDLLIDPAIMVDYIGLTKYGWKSWN
jgi:hypothetical protein